MLMSDFNAYVRYNGSTWEYQIQDEYSIIVMITNFNSKKAAEDAARVAIQEMITKAGSIADATEWEKIEL